MHVPKYTLMYSHIPAVYIYTPVYISVYINIPLYTAKTLYVYICSMLFIYVSYTYPFTPYDKGYSGIVVVISGLFGGFEVI